MRKVLLAVLSMSFLLCAGCGSSTSFEEDMIKKYKENNRIERYYELNDDYDGNRLILLLNSEENHPVLNALINFFSFVMPEIPEICASGGLIAIFYGVAWWIGVTLTGGGILAVLAWLGTRCGGIPGIPPAVGGILFLALMFSILENLFSLL